MTTPRIFNIIYMLFIEVWLSLVERLVWDQDAAGSNPVTSTILFKTMFKYKHSFFIYEIHHKNKFDFYNYL